MFAVKLVTYQLFFLHTLPSSGMRRNHKQGFYRRTPGHWDTARVWTFHLCICSTGRKQFRGPSQTLLLQDSYRIVDRNCPTGEHLKDLEDRI